MQSVTRDSSCVCLEYFKEMRLSGWFAINGAVFDSVCLVDSILFIVFYRSIFKRHRLGSAVYAISEFGVVPNCDQNRCTGFIGFV